MLRLRDEKGQAAPIAEAFRFVEICDLTGAVAKLIYTDHSGMIREVTAADPEAAKYSALYGVKFCPIIRLN